jgi:hypothetical protein
MDVHRGFKHVRAKFKGELVVSLNENVAAT